MLILWRYQIKHFCIKLLFISLLSVASMLTFKVNEMSKLLSFGVSAKTLILFILYQIPLLLPVTLAISGFFAAYLVVQQLSEMNIFSSLQSSGLSLGKILSPLLFIAIVVSSLNFYLVMQVLPLSRIYSTVLLQDVSQMNPLVVLKKGKIETFKDAIVHMNVDPSHTTASDVFILFQNPYTKYLNLFKADRFTCQNKSLIEIENSSLISTIDQETELLPTILLENAVNQSIPLSFFTTSLAKSESSSVDALKKSYETMTLREILLAYNEEFSTKSLDSSSDFFDINKKQYLLSEGITRIAFGALPLLLIFIGSTLSIRSVEKKPSFNIILLIFTPLFSITAALLAKSLRHIPYVSAPIVMISYAISAAIAIKYRYLLEKGGIICK